MSPLQGAGYWGDLCMCKSRRYQKEGHLLCTSPLGMYLETPEILGVFSTTNHTTISAFPLHSAWSPHWMWIIKEYFTNGLNVWYKKIRVRLFLKLIQENITLVPTKGTKWPGMNSYETNFLLHFIWPTLIFISMFGVVQGKQPWSW